MLGGFSPNLPFVNGQESEKNTDGVVLTSPGLFVYRCFDPVEGIPAEEAEESARLDFEEQSPYAPEQLAVGVVTDGDGRVGVFGCERSALPAASRDQFLLPGFFPFFGWEREPGTVEKIEAGGGGALLFFDRGGKVPSDLVGLAGSGESDDSAEIAEVLEALGRPDVEDSAIRRLSLDGAGADSRGRFRAVAVDDEGARREWSTGERVLWKADLRPTGEIERFRADKKSGERIWWAARAVAGILIALVLAQGILWGFASWVEGREALREVREPQVAAVEERADLAARLGDLGESRISVFERLGELNLLRPNGIQFLSVEFREPDWFEVEGRTSEVRVLNEYIEKLGNDSRFIISEAPRPRSRDGRIEFVLAVRVPAAGKGAGR